MITLQQGGFAVDYLWGVLFVLLIAGLVLVGFLVTALEAMALGAIFGGRSVAGDPAPPDRKTNCPECGALTPVDPGNCRYCDAPLTDAEPTDRA